jgi:hypothetical protein
MKNAIRDFMRKPVQVICVIVMLVFFVFGFIVAGNGDAAVNEYRDVRELYLIIVGLYALMAVMVIRGGFKTGTTFYAMPDVNFLFSSPIPQRNVMIYGMVRSIGSYLISSVFIFYNYVNAKNIYNVGIEVMIPVTLGYVLVAILAQVAAMAIYVKRNSDGSGIGFYESVLQSTEKTHSVITAAKEGTTQEVIPRNVKVGKTGLGKGYGANAFYYKHKIENRRARIFILDIWSVFSILVALVFAFFVRNQEGGIVGAIALGSYIQMFAVALGRVNRELTKPFIYLTPEPSFVKLLQCLRESVKGFLADAVIVGVGFGIIFRENIPGIALLIAVRLSFSMVFTAANCVMQRLWGGEGNRIVTMVLYIAIIIAMLVPAIVSAIILGLGTLTLFPLLPIGQTVLLFIALCNIPVSLIAFFLSRKMLDYAEQNHQ